MKRLRKSVPIYLPIDSLKSSGKRKLNSPGKCNIQEITVHTASNYYMHQNFYLFTKRMIKDNNFC